MKNLKRKYVAAGFFLLMFLVSGCSKNIVDEVGNELKATHESESHKKELKHKDIVLRVEDASVSYGDVLFYIYQAKEKYEKIFSDAIWDVELEDGDTFEKHAKEEILREVTEVLIVCEEAKEENVTLSKEEKQEAKEKAEAFIRKAGKDAEEQWGFDLKRVENIYQQNALARKMYDKVEKENGANGQGEAFEEKYAKWSEHRRIDLSVELWKNIHFKFLKDDRKDNL
ncbi:hypothetical protein [[Clostridium] polysaccharolyticum]|uniref:Lipoprotein n=1 Tax=[Clostridium] polysaccharolyticum TaxID=29364 RepID=A0A1I0EAI4_9FIRM|nr:hypothetical protein [[Clostridium] polysaccharolyticum]SET41754.1 hypothetical protein SAMN04487772_11957 [[Clostridium] polysaccharolyticum]